MEARTGKARYLATMLIAVIIVFVGCNQKPKESSERLVSDIKYQGMVYQYCRSVAVKSCSKDSILATDSDFGELYFTDDGRALLHDKSISDPADTYYIGTCQPKRTGIECKFTLEYAIPKQNEGDTSTIPIDPNTGQLKKMAPFSMNLQTLNCDSFDFYSQRSDGKKDGTVYYKSATKESKEFIEQVNKISALSFLFKSNQIDKNSSTNLNGIDQSGKAVLDFLFWYKVNKVRLSSIRMIKNMEPDKTDSTKLYSVNFEGTEQYLTELKKSGFVSDKYLNTWRNYFKEKDAYLKANPQWDGPPYGFEFDFVMLSQDEDEDFAQLSKAKTATQEISKEKVLVKVLFPSHDQLSYFMYKQGEGWVIDKIEIGTSQ